VPSTRDLLLGVVLSCAAEGEYLAAGGGHRPLGAFVAASFVVLAWRDRWPIAVGVLIASVLVVQAALGGGMLRGATPLVAVAVAMFTVGMRCRWAPAAVSAVVVTVALAAANQLDSATAFSFLNDLVFFGLVVVTAPAAVGLLLSSRNAQIALLQERTARLAREEDGLVEATRAEERARLARAVHEAVAQRLGEIAVQAAGAERLGSSDIPRTVAALGKIENAARLSLEELRGAVGVLRTLTGEDR
jgi:signal transduction histidine kinase